MDSGNAKNNVHCSVCGTLVSTTGDGFASCLCLVCSSANDGVVLSPEVIRQYMNSLPASSVNYMDLSGNNEDRLPREEVVSVAGKKWRLGDQLKSIITGVANKKKKPVPVKDSIEVVRSKQRSSIFSPLGSDIESVDKQLKDANKK